MSREDEVSVQGHRCFEERADTNTIAPRFSPLFVREGTMAGVNEVGRHADAGRPLCTFIFLCSHSACLPPNRNSGTQALPPSGALNQS